MKRLVFFIAVLGYALGMGAQTPDVKKSDAIMEESMQNYVKAAQLYEEAAKGYEQNGVIDTLCWYRAGVCNLKEKQYQKALTFFTKLESSKIVTGDLLYSMGDTYYGLKQYDKSESYLLKSMEVDSAQELNACKKLVLVSYNSKQFEKAAKYADEALNLDGSDVNILYMKTLSLEQTGNIDEAVATAERLLDVKPNYSKGVEKLGLLYVKQTDAKYDKEKKKYEAMKAPTRVDFSNTTKRLDAISQEYKKAIPLLEQALAKKPNDEVVKKALDNAKSRLK